METVFIEATNISAGGMNWGKFMLGRFTTEEGSRRAEVDSRLMLAGRGWSYDFLLVLDLQTGEAALFKPGGLAKADLDKHQIWVCPMFEPFLAWLYEQDLTNLSALPKLIEIDDPKSSLSGYRRKGPT